MNAEEKIKLNKEALYSSLTSSDKFGKFFNKSILHYATIMEVFSYNKLEGISYEKLCLSIPKTLGSRSSIQNLLNEGLDQKLLFKVENIPKIFLSPLILTVEFYFLLFFLLILKFLVLLQLQYLFL